MLDIIEVNPKILGGQPVIKGTRIPVARIVALVVMGYSLKDLKEEYPYLPPLTKKDIADIFSFYQHKFCY